MNKQNHNPIVSLKEIAITKPSLVGYAITMGLIFPLVFYLILPMAGIEIFKNLLSFSHFILLFVLILGSISYFYYLNFILSHPSVLIYFFIIAWPLVEYVNQILILKLGINLHLRLVILMFIGVPTIWLGWQNLAQLIKRLPHFKYYLGFCILVFLYFIFYNSYAVDPRFGLQNVWSEGSVGVIQLIAYIYCGFGIILSAVSIFKQISTAIWFDRLNKSILWISSLISLITIICYPFGILSTNLDGFHRAIGIFSHPNPFSHHMGIIVLYLMGIFCYYQGTKNNRIPGWLLITGIIVNLLAFLLGMSKTAIAIWILSSSIMMLLNFSSSTVRKSIFKTGIVLIFLLILSLSVFQAIADQSFIELLQARFEQAQSFNWRVEVWQSLLADIEGAYIWIGHGFTAANSRVFQLTFNDLINSRPLMMVHNGYIALLYDFGIMGWLLFLAVLSLVFNVIRRLHLSAFKENRSLLVTIISMSVYFMVVCGFDEMTYMFDAPILFWTLSTLLYCLSLKESQI